MLQKVVRDYIGAFHWEKIKKTYKNGAVSILWLYTYLLILYPAIIDLNREDSIGLFRYYITVVPILFSVFTLTLAELRLPKQMLLCPLDENERKKYLYQLFTIRILVPVLSGAAACILYGWWNGGIGPKPVLTNLFAVFSFTLNASITVYPGSVYVQNDKQQKARRIRDERFKGLIPVSITGICIGILLVAEENFLWGLSWQEAGWKWILYGVTIGLLVLFDLLVLRYLKPVVDIASDYEKTNLALDAPK